MWECCAVDSTKCMILSGGAECKVGQKAAQSHILAPTVLEY